MSKSLIQHATISAALGALSVVALAAGPASAASGSTVQAASAPATASLNDLQQAMGGFAWIC